MSNNLWHHCKNTRNRKRFPCGAENPHHLSAKLNCAFFLSKLNHSIKLYTGSPMSFSGEVASLGHHLGKAPGNWDYQSPIFLYGESCKYTVLTFNYCFHFMFQNTWWSVNTVRFFMTHCFHRRQLFFNLQIPVRMWKGLPYKTQRLSHSNIWSRWCRCLSFISAVLVCMWTTGKW